MLESQVNAREIRRRLFNPPNARRSSELEIVSEVGFRRMRRQQDHDRHMAARAEAEAQREQVIRERIAAVAAEAKRKALESGLPPPRPTVAQILEEVCRRYNVTELDVRCKRRTAEIVMPRHVTMYLCKNLTELSYPQIGHRLGGRDHTTVIAGVSKIAELIKTDLHLAAEIEDISRSLTVTPASVSAIPAMAEGIWR